MGAVVGGGVGGGVRWGGWRVGEEERKEKKRKKEEKTKGSDLAKPDYSNSTRVSNERHGIIKTTNFQGSFE